MKKCRRCGVGTNQFPFCETCTYVKEIIGLRAENKQMREALESVRDRAAHTPAHKIFHTIAETSLLNVRENTDG